MLNTGASFDGSSPICAILGGVGPMAGVKIHEKVIRYSKTSCDQDHMELVHLSTPILDRTHFLLTKEGKNPGNEMFTAVRGLSKLAASRRKFVIAGVPCNTFHAPPIWNRLLDQVILMNHRIAEEYGDGDSNVLPGQIHFVHMLKETVTYCTSLGAKSIGLLSTTGTRKSGVYRDLFATFKIDLLEVDMKVQADVQDAIYNPNYGIKALDRACPKVVGAFKDFIRQIKKKGATAVILGCTEIPIALPEKEFEGVTLIDPMDVLARRLVDSAGKISDEEKRFLNYKHHRFDDLVLNIE